MRRRVMRWYEAHGRHDLPWRRSRDPYTVLVSEVMLQQTQVDRVLPYFSLWMVQWPDAASLAKASPAEVIRAWAGLGYNRRALNLHRAAQAAVERWEGVLPSDEEQLRTLPGVGPYTAAAVACFVGEQPTVVVDTNIGRVIARAILGAPSMPAAGEKATKAAAAQLLPEHDARNWNLALMDLGATVCKSRNPSCEECPLESVCAWRLAGSPPEPSNGARSSVPFEETARFARGRIVAALRDHEHLEFDEIAGMLPGQHAAYANKYLQALERDGLVVRVPGTEDTWALPGGIKEG